MGPSVQHRSPGRSSLGRRDRRLALRLAVLAFLVYNANLRSLGDGATSAARFLPFALWGGRTVYLDPVLDPVFRAHPEDPPRVLDSVNGHQASADPIVTPLLAAPLYLPAALDLSLHNWVVPRMAQLGLIMEKVAASAVASLAAGWMFLLLRRRLDRRRSLLLAALFAFGTSTWTLSSQALRPQGPAELFCVAALWFLTPSRPAVRHALAAGLAAGLLAANHLPDLPLALAFAAAALFRADWRGARSAAFAAAAALPLALTAAYSEVTFGRLAPPGFLAPPSPGSWAGWLTGALPAFVWLLALLLPNLRRAPRIALAAAGVLAVGVQAAGAFRTPGEDVYRAWRDRSLPALPLPAPPPPPPRVGPASDFYAVVPCRLFDTRRSRVPLAGEAPRRFPIAGAGCGIPATAVAVAGTATTLAESGEGLVVVRSDLGLGRLEMRYTAEQPRSLQVFLPLAPDGSIHVTAEGSGRAQLVLDVSGYFAPAKIGSTAPPVSSSAPRR